jgi:cob(I)alamin adenosyltransferase
MSQMIIVIIMAFLTHGNVRIVVCFVEESRVNGVVVNLELKMKAGIYTRKGDSGMTSLGNSEKVSKTNCRISAIGSIDELNSIIGLLIFYSSSCMTTGFCDSPSKVFYRGIQDDLFVIGSILAEVEDLEIDQDRIAYIEEHIDEVSAKLKPLHNFIIPGGESESCWLHFARTVCRRAEREIVVVSEVDGKIDPKVLIYMNRLSDLFFVRARLANSCGEKDILWKKECPLKGR